MATQATPAKLRDGSWGARTTQRVTTGSLIQVRTRGGKTWTASVCEVVWTDGAVCLVRTGENAKPAPRARKRRNFHARGYRIDGTGDAWEQ